MSSVFKTLPGTKWKDFIFYRSPGHWHQHQEGSGCVCCCQHVWKAPCHHASGKRALMWAWQGHHVWRGCDQLHHQSWNPSVRLLLRLHSHSAGKCASTPGEHSSIKQRDSERCSAHFSRLDIIYECVRCFIGLSVTVPHRSPTCSLAEPQLQDRSA